MVKTLRSHTFFLSLSLSLSHTHTLWYVSLSGVSEQLWSAIKRAKLSRAVFLTTHSMEEAEHLCDRRKNRTRHEKVRYFLSAD